MSRGHIYDNTLHRPRGAFKQRIRSVWLGMRDRAELRRLLTHAILLDRRPGCGFQSFDLTAVTVFVLAQQDHPLISVDRPQSGMREHLLGQIDGF